MVHGREVCVTDNGELESLEGSSSFAILSHFLLISSINCLDSSPS
ncbi:hypothetical protein [Candidatus Protochlamydia sp. W-9]|nr:hypothetical protein [Candidatus Protochlamydia sp. W-9]